MTIDKPYPETCQSYLGFPCDHHLRDGFPPPKPRPPLPLSALNLGLGRGQAGRQMTRNE